MKLKQFVTSIFCLQCDGCCRFKEKESIFRPLGFTLIPYKDYYLCPKLDLKTNRCKIYLKRPFDCQLYPLLLTKQNQKTILALHKNCPFVAKLSKRVNFKNYLNYLKKFFTLKKTINFIKENSSLIQNYPKEEIKNLFALTI